MAVKKMMRAAECFFIFGGVPLLVYFERVPLPKIAILLAAAISAAGLLYWGDSFTVRAHIPPPAEGFGRTLAWRALLVAAVTAGLTLWIVPEALFSFPRGRPLLWLVVMALYPLLSALPQELLYRAFFFERYDVVFTSPRVMMGASTLAFAFLHIIYDNGWAVLLTLAGGWLFARTYRRTESLFWVSVEHALYGAIIFTVGLGRFFYEAG